MEDDDPRWQTLAGGYRLPYDPTPALRRLQLQSTSEEAWAELWNQLHHHGDVGEASYAAVPALVRIRKKRGTLGWNLYALAAAIEVGRHRCGNPAMPEWLESDYREAWTDLLSLALTDLATTQDPLLVRSALAAVALAKGEIKLGALVASLDASEIDELLE